MTGFITRRRLIWSFAGVTGGVALAGAGSLAACGRATRVAFAWMPERLAETLSEVFEPERLARHWAEVGRQSAAADEILDRPGLVAALEMDCIESRRALVRKQFAEDFAAGDVIVADRLLVARSEYLIAAFCMATVSSDAGNV
jgi:hypothetical protein